VSLWRTPEGDEIVICDDCGVAADGTRPDLASMVKLSGEQVVGAMPMAEFCNTLILTHEVLDHCPECTAARSPDQEKLQF
jgi:hypothetical protein